MGHLYIVSTPIGNLGDITYRAVQVLGAVTRILAEDTRRTAILLNHYGISTPLVSAHAHNEAARTRQLLEWLDRGEDVALVSDAGTPLISDPGVRIVREVIAAGHDVVPVPGASAVLAALVVSGFETVPFSFLGFLPRTARERAARLEEVAALDHTAVICEAPGRLVRLLHELERYCGGERRVMVARELTKVHETLVRGTLAEVAAYYGSTPPRGEVVVVLAGREQGPGDAGAEARALAIRLLAEGLRPSAIARELVRQLGTPRNQAYEIALSLAGERRGGKA